VRDRRPPVAATLDAFNPTHADSLTFVWRPPGRSLGFSTLNRLRSSRAATPSSRRRKHDGAPQNDHAGAPGAGAGLPMPVGAEPASSYRSPVGSAGGPT